MKTPLFVLVVLFAVTAGFAAAPRSTPGLPFDDMRIVAPAQLEAKPTPSFMPSPFALKAEFDKRALAGEVLLGFTISAKGKVEKVKVVKSTNPEMAKLAAAYLGKCVFRPARLGGKAVASEAEMLFFDVPAA